MDGEQSLALWRQGRDAWNAWAKAMLDRRAEMERDGTWALHRHVFGDEKPDNEATGAWMRDAAADFQAQVFEEPADFSSFLFPGSARFDQATFQQDAGFDSATFSGDAGFYSTTFGGSADFSNLTFSGSVGFSSATFSEDARFNCATFSESGGNASFDSATFREYAWFDGTTFGGYAWFGRAIFGREARFGKATFNRDTWFDEATFVGSEKFTSATFSGNARFEETTFEADAWFNRLMFSESARFHKAKFRAAGKFAQASFKGYTTFYQGQFYGVADFSAVRVERTFTLEGARFNEVPDFIQAHFEEAPRLDNVSIPEVGGVARFFLPMLQGVDPNFDLSSCYRALKRLAIEAHDQARELDYSANELKSLRGYPDRPLPCPLNLLRKDDKGRRPPLWPGGLRGTMRFWFGLGYEVLSNFGRSIALPLFWWGLATAGFTWAYLEQAISADHCAIGESTPWSAAVGLSIRKALPFAGIASSEKLNQIYACLYGIHGESGRLAVLPDRFTPVIPDAVDYLGMVQLVLSILLLFLFLLAVRSHFRIR